MYSQMYSAAFDKKKERKGKNIFIMAKGGKSARSKNHCRVSLLIPRHVGDYVCQQTDFLSLRGLLLPHCNVSIYVFPEKELRGLSPNFHTHVPVNDLYEYISMSGPPIFCSRICRSIVGIYV
jgi:hypothetical protein